MVLQRASLALTAFAGLILMTSCAGPKYPNCNTDDHCSEKGELCVEGTCQQCRTDDNCGDGQQCVGGRCEVKPECSDEADCPDNQICRSGKCQLECEAAGDCAAGLKCMDNRCVAENACSSDADCEDGAACRDGLCDVNASRALSLCGYPTVQFAFNESQLTPEVIEGLNSVAECIKNAGGTLVVEGHCDERGTEEYNLALGDRRARAVVDYLTNLGVPRGMMDVVSKGETEPLESGSNPSAWSQNRRAEFELGQ